MQEPTTQEIQDETESTTQSRKVYQCPNCGSPRLENFCYNCTRLNVLISLLAPIGLNRIALFAKLS